MAVTYVAVATKNDESFSTGGGALTGFNLDCTGADAAIVFVGWLDGGGHTIDSVTIGGNTMTSIGAAADGSNNGELIQGFYYANPGTGNQSVVVDPSTGSLNRAAVVVAISLSGVDQTTPTSGYTTTGSGIATSTEADVTVSSATDNLVLVAAACEAAVTFTADTGTERADIQRTTNGNISMCVSTEAGAASVATQHTIISAQRWSGYGFSVDAAAAASGTTLGGLVGSNSGLLG
jgi:hypothetical protein